MGQPRPLIQPEVRRARLSDALGVADLLNDIIAAGGTTAMIEPVSSEELTTWMQTPDALWHAAFADDGVGVQWIEPHQDLPKGMADIASFVRRDRSRCGIGSALMTQTKRGALAAGYTALHANIRADNAQGLAYYRSHGFAPIKTVHGVDLGNGCRVSQVRTLCRLTDSGV